MIKAGSQDYFTRIHGKCANPENCRLRTCLSGEMFCQDNTSEHTSDCVHYIKPVFIGKISWTMGFHNWSEIEKIYKESRNAYFALPIVKCDEKYTVGDVEDFQDNTVGIRGVIYTTKEQINNVYGRPEFYLPSVLTKVFRKELMEMA